MRKRNMEERKFTEVEEAAYERGLNLHKEYNDPELLKQIQETEQERIIKILEEMQSELPYPNFSNGYQKDLNEEDKIIKKILQEAIKKIKEKE